MRHGRQLSVIMMLGVACLSGSVRGTDGAVARTAIFVQGLADASGANTACQTADCQIVGNPATDGSLASAANGNWGGAPFLDFGRSYKTAQRVLYRFDLRYLAGRCRRITRARLILNVARVKVGGERNALPSPLAIELYALAPANSGWIEGSHTSGELDETAARWNGRAADLAWAGDKGCGRTGVDYRALALATHTVTGLEQAPGVAPLSFEINDAALLETWVKQPDENAGLLLKSAQLEDELTEIDLGLIRLASDDSADPAQRPRLEVDYEPLEPDDEFVTTLRDGMVNGAARPSYRAMASSLFSGAVGSYGGATDLRIGVEPGGGQSQRWRGLLRFELAALDRAPEQVVAARLRLTVHGVSFSGVNPQAPQRLKLHRIATVNAPWREGVRQDGGEEAGAATWGWMNQSQKPWAGVALGGPGLEVAGWDFAEPVAAEVMVTPALLHEGDTVTFEVANPLLLQNWVYQAGLNGGFRLASSTLEAAGLKDAGATARIDFYSNDEPVPSRRPCLELNGLDSRQAVRAPWWAME